MFMEDKYDDDQNRKMEWDTTSKQNFKACYDLWLDRRVNAEVAARQLRNY